MRANDLKLEKDYDQSIELYEQAIELHADPRYWHDMGVAYFSQKKREDAKRSFEKSLDLDDKYFLEYRSLGAESGELKDYKGSVEMLEKALQISSDDPTICYDIARSYEGIGTRDPEALKAAFEYSSKAYEHLGDVQGESGSLDTALNQRMTGDGKECCAMKRRWVVISLLILLFTANNVFAGGVFKFGLDAEGRHKVSGYGTSGTEDVEAGASLTAEFFAPVGSVIDLGGGVSFQAPRSQKDFEGDFSFIPFYFAMRTRFLDRDTTPYFIGQLGYNLFSGDSDYKGTGVYEADLDGGLYWGLGGGVIIQKHFLIELLYTENNGSATTMGYDFDVEYSKFTLSFGFNY